jgi:cellulose synthase/poly-beta-1,6-N-acetylglucosamine synthase-like glycosyltransferase
MYVPTTTTHQQAGNLNSAIFNLNDPSKQPFIGEAKMVVINDARHQLKPDFLQRTMPYFFELDSDGMTYRWGKYAFVQTPQRFQVLACHLLTVCNDVLNCLITCILDTAIL